jgi:hypothetical protein
MAPDPAVRGGAAKPADVVADPVSAMPSAPKPTGDATPSSSSGPASVQGNSVQPLPAVEPPKAAPVPSATDDTLVVADEGAVSLPIILGAVGLLAILILLLARKK